MTTYLGKSCSFCLPRVPFVNCRQFMYLVISLLVLRAGYGIWLYQFLIIAYLFTLNYLCCHTAGDLGLVGSGSVWSSLGKLQFITDRSKRCFCCALFYLSMFVRFLLVFDLLDSLVYHHHLLGKNCPLGFSLVLFLLYCRPSCMCPFPIWCLRQGVEFEILPWSG